MSTAAIRIQLIDSIRSCIHNVANMLLVVERMIGKIELNLRQFGDVVSNGVEDFSQQVQGSQHLRGGFYLLSIVIFQIICFNYQRIWLISMSTFLWRLMMH
jgi:hypothetical protein